MATQSVGLIPIYPCFQQQQPPAQVQQVQALLTARNNKQPKPKNKPPKSAEQKEAEERRKQRNREHARRSRERKKNEQSQLEQQLEQLRLENQHLQNLVREHLPNPQRILHECNNIDRTDFELLQSLAANKQAYVISDPRLPDNPVVYASERFCLLTGFSRDEVVGRNCRFLQGPQTDPRAVAALGKAVEQGSDCTTTLLNYKKDGTPFWNQCFVAALRDSNKNIVNYVGVQYEADHGPNEMQPPTKRRRKVDPETTTSSSAGAASMSITSSGYGCSAEQEASQFLPEPIVSIAPAPLPPKSIEVVQRSVDQMFDCDPKNLDWSMLAEIFEADDGDALSVCTHDTGLTEDTAEQDELNNNNMMLGGGGDLGRYSPENSLAENLSANRISDASPTDEIVETESFHESYMRSFCASPLEIISRTVRSELLDALLTSKGDVGDKRFLSVLAILERIYESLGYNASPTNLYTGTWRSLDRPHYGDCLGTNDHGDFMYTLGKMSFDMFKPGHLKCSVQRTLNNIETVCEMSHAPAAAPWSLRRELAAWDPNQQQADDDDDDMDCGGNGSPQQSSRHLKSYDVAVALTIEPYAEKPLKALNVTKGYMLPDPNTPNRLTVWFTSGELSPVSPQSNNVNGNNPDEQVAADDSSPYGGLQEWKELFGAEHKRTWSESFRVMGAKLLMGAELPDGMDDNGTMKYMLHRPMGGHGVAYVDVLYLDDDLLVLKSSTGKIHVMARDNQSVEEPQKQQQQQQQQQQQKPAADDVPPPVPVSPSSADLELITSMK